MCWPSTLHNICALLACSLQRLQRAEEHHARAGLQLHLSSLRRSHPDQLASGPEYEGNVIVHPSAKIGRDCKIGPNVSIGIGCELENGVRVANSVLLHRVKVTLFLRQAVMCLRLKPVLYVKRHVNTA